MIVFVEPQMQGNKHIQVNSSMLKIFCEKFEDNIVVHCDEFHRENLDIFFSQKEKKKIFYQTFPFSGDKELSKSFIFYKIIREMLLILGVFRKYKDVNFIFFASMFPFTGVLFNLFSIFNKRKKIVCLHGEIGVLKMERLKPTTILYKLVIKLFLATIKKNTTLLFYGKTIENKIKQVYKKIKTISIDHPYNYDVSFTQKDTPKAGQPLLFAHIGTALMNKNSHMIYKLAKLQEKNIIGGYIKFVQVGNVSSEVKKYSNNLVEMVNKQGFMDFGVYEDNLMSVDYFVYFFKNNSYYDLCPSGTFFDAIRYKKPIISLRNPFFEYYFNKLGKIGYLFDSVETMSQKINEILTDRQEYFEIIKNIENSQKQLSLDFIGNDLLKKINSIVNDGSS